MSSKFKRSALGARVPHEKKTSGMATVAMPLPEKIVLPMQQHIGAPCTPTVKKGDAVLVGTVVGAAGGFSAQPSTAACPASWRPWRPCICPTAVRYRLSSSGPTASRRRTRPVFRPR
ncbi:MAG: hypothetical protein ACLTLX_10860 [Ruthenibacterium lactatiformans]